jgi:hypothetical protein
MMGDNRWGPVGYTTIARCILWPYMTDTTTDVERFVGVPPDVAREAMLSLPLAVVPWQVADAADWCAADDGVVSVMVVDVDPACKCTGALAV